MTITISIHGSSAPTVDKMQDTSLNKRTGIHAENADIPIGENRGGGIDDESPSHHHQKSHHKKPHNEDLNILDLVMGLLGPLGGLFSSLMGGKEKKHSKEDGGGLTIDIKVGRDDAQSSPGKGLKWAARGLQDAHDVKGNKVDLFKGTTLDHQGMAKIANDSNLDEKTRAAAQYLSDNPDEFDKLESSGKYNGTGARGVKDGKLGSNDVADVAAA